MGHYGVWMDAFERTGDPIAASDQVLVAVRAA
jgi:hypothetical protein